MNRWWKESFEAVLLLAVVCIMAGVSAIIGTFLFMGVNKTMVFFGQKPLINDFYTIPGGQKVIVPTPKGYKPEN